MPRWRLISHALSSIARFAAHTTCIYLPPLRAIVVCLSLPSFLSHLWRVHILSLRVSTALALFSALNNPLSVRLLIPVVSSWPDKSAARCGCVFLSGLFYFLMPLRRADARTEKQTLAKRKHTESTSELLLLLGQINSRVSAKVVRF